VPGLRDHEIVVAVSRTASRGDSSHFPEWCNAVADPHSVVSAA
jgi:hypothetical protein